MKRTTVVVLVLGLTCLFAGVAAATVRTWDGGGYAVGLVNAGYASDPTNWVGDVAPVTGDDIVLNDTCSTNVLWDMTNLAYIGSWLQTEDYEGTVTVYTVYPDAGYGNYTNFRITGNVAISNGVWTHRANPSGNTEVNRLRVSIDGNLIVGPLGRINVDTNGFKADYGPGAAGGNPPRQAGGHGGEGGMNTEYGTYYPKPPYGSIKAPTRLGSGSNGASGGGAVYLTVGGLTTLDGVISAKGGGPLGYPWSGGGAGGSICLVTGSLTGSGTNDASGGTVSGRGGGGGGRVAVILTSGSSFGSVTMTAAGGSTIIAGGSGTIYLETPAQAGNGTLIIRGTGVNPALWTPCIALLPYDTPYNLNTDFSEIVITNMGNLGVYTNTTLNLGNLSNFKVYGPAQSYLTLRSTNFVTFPAALIVSNYTLVLESNLTFNGSVTIATNGAISHTKNVGSDRYQVSLTVNGDLTVQAGGAINADYRGYWNRYGPGRGFATPAPYTDTRRGGSYGGEAGVRQWSPSNAPTYGSAIAPTNLGSGGQQQAGTETLGRAGGGNVRLIVSGLTTINGRVSAMGEGAGFVGAGSGGSLYLTTGTLAGNGGMDASGGYENSAGGGGGGGGRIAVVLTAGESFGNVSMTATGGAAGVSSGAAGTVYTETPSQGAGRGNLIVDNRVLQPTLQTNMTYYPATYPDTPPTISNELARVAVTVTNTGWFRLAADAQVRDIHVMSANSVLDLKSRTLTVTSFEHPLGAGTVTNYGAIVWVPPLSGVLLMVR